MIIDGKDLDFVIMETKFIGELGAGISVFLKESRLYEE